MDRADCLKNCSRKGAKIAKTQRRVKWFGRAFASLRSLRLCVNQFLDKQRDPFAVLRDFKFINPASMQARLDHLDLCLKYSR